MTVHRPPMWPIVVAAFAIATFGKQQMESASRRPRLILDSTAHTAKAPSPSAADPVAPPSLWRLSWAVWVAVFWRVYEAMNRNRLMAVAAGVVFYSLLALFPAVAAFVSLYGLVADASTIHQHLSLAAGILPGGAVAIVNEQLTRLTAHRTSALSLGFTSGLLFALWSANAGTKAVLDGLNVAYGEAEKRGFIRLTLVAFAFTLGAIVSLMFAAGALVVAPIALAQLGLGSLTDSMVGALRWPVLLMLAMIALALLYRFGPSRSNARFMWVSPGALAAAIGWLVVSALYSWYIANFGTYDATYGSLGAAVGMMMWMWISMIVLLLGAELNAQIERKVKETPARD